MLLVSAAGVIPGIAFLLQQQLLSAISGRTVHWRAVVFSSGDWLAVGLLTPLAYYLGRRFPLSQSVWKRRVGIHLLGAIGLAIGWATLGMIWGRILKTFPGEPPFAQSYVTWILITIPIAILLYSAVLLGTYAYTYFLKAQSSEANAAALTAQLAEARLGALRMQLHPHFLFNSLNAINVLLRDKDMAGASKMLELLADMLRQVLRPDLGNEIKLADEIKFLEHYLAIEQVRFPDRLGVRWAIDDEARTALVPAFILQPLVENAIKHGIAPRAAAGTITILARVAGSKLELSVRDDGVGLGATRQEGVGFTNTHERLRTLYGDKANMSVTAPLEGGVEVLLSIPFHYLDE